MAFIFVVETGMADSDANSYSSVEYADDYMESNTHLSEEWFNLEEEDKQRLLVRASKMLDIRFRWNGTRIEQDSGLKWPRAGVYDEDNFLIPDDVIPRILQDATVEFAGYLMDTDWTAPRANDEFKELQVDVIDIKFNTDYRRAYIPPTIVSMLEGLGASNTGLRPGFKRIVRT